MAPTVSRKNGRLASCEPCRKSKLRCDNQQPVCARCQRRGIKSCFIHPAPLSKGSPGASRRRVSESSGLISTGIPEQRPPVIKKRPSTCNAAPPSFSFHSWRLEGKVPDAGDYSNHGVDEREYSERLSHAIEIIRQLRFLPMIEEFITNYHKRISAPVPGRLVQVLIQSIKESPLIRPYLQDGRLRSDCDIAGIAKESLHPFETNGAVTSSTTVPEFCRLYTAPTVRVELIGLLCTLAARAFLYRQGQVKERNPDFAPSILRCSDMALRLSRDITPHANDMILWLAYENMQLKSYTDGDTGIAVWRGLSDLATDIFTFGLNYEKTITSNAPPFLIEIRRNTFAVSYRADKGYCWLFDRPPRISRRYADCKLPLELPESALLGDKDEFELACSNLTADGWSTEEEYYPSTWARLRARVSEFREDISEYGNCSDVQLCISKLRDVSSNCSKLFDSLPSRLIYTPECWTSGLEGKICLMLGMVHLLRSHIDLQVHRILSEHEEGHKRELLQISEKMLSVLLKISAAYDRSVYLPGNASALSLHYGLPCAAALTNALKCSTQDPSYSFEGVSRSQVVRTLTIFVAQLEAGCEQEGGNQEPCRAAARSISQVLDDVLNLRTPSATLQTPPSDLLGLNAYPLSALTQSLSATIQMPGLDFGGFDSFDDIGFADWALNMDWTGPNNEWNILGSGLGP